LGIAKLDCKIQVDIGNGDLISDYDVVKGRCRGGAADSQVALTKVMDGTSGILIGHSTIGRVLFEAIPIDVSVRREMPSSQDKVTTKNNLRCCVQ